MHPCIHACMHVRMYACVCMHACPYVCTYVCMCVYACVCMHACTYVCTHVRMWVCVYAGMCVCTTMWVCVHGACLVCFDELARVVEGLPRLGSLGGDGQHALHILKPIQTLHVLSAFLPFCLSAFLPFCLSLPLSLPLSLSLSFSVHLSLSPFFPQNQKSSLCAFLMLSFKSHPHLHLRSRLQTSRNFEKLRETECDGQRLMGALRKWCVLKETVKKKKLLCSVCVP